MLVRILRHFERIIETDEFSMDRIFDRQRIAAEDGRDEIQNLPQFIDLLEKDL